MASGLFQLFSGTCELQSVSCLIIHMTGGMLSVFQDEIFASDCAPAFLHHTDKQIVVLRHTGILVSKEYLVVMPL